MAAGSQAAGAGLRPAVGEALEHGRGRGVHLLGLDEPHIRSTDGMTFFVLVIAQERSVQLRASIDRFFQNFESCPSSAR